MDVHIRVNCDNAAFEETPMHELARILHKLANDIEAYERLNGETDPHRTLRDINGNTVGEYNVMD